MKKHALLIGVNDYPTSLGRLSFAAEDAIEIAQTLQELYGFDEDELTLLTCREKGVFTPSRNNIRNQFKDIRDTKKDFDLLLVGYWGHGKVLASPSGAHELYLCSQDTYESDLEDTGVSLNFLLDCLQKARAKDTCLILDCCQSVAGSRRGGIGLTQEAYDHISRGARDILVSPQSESDIGRNRTTAILNSCSFTQLAYEWEDRKHGIFTAHLLDAMRSSGRLTDWATYVSDNVPKTAKQQCGVIQKPFLKIEGGGDIHFPTIVPVKPTPISLLAEAEVEAARIIAHAKQQAEAEAAQIVEKAKQQSPTSAAVLHAIPASAVSPKPLPTVVQDGKTAGDRMVLTIKGVEYPFRWCPPGTFMMGSPPSEKGRGDNETQHQVTLSRGFWMLETQVTQGMWESISGSNPSKFGGSKNLPVEQVSWEECQAYIMALHAFSRGVAPEDYWFALPTEAQWEYACRAGTTTPFNFGSTLKGDKANCDGNHPYGTSTKGKDLEKTSDVGSYPANAWGLYDMHGNVLEWCLDWYGDYPSGAVTDPTGAPHGSYRVIRGGGWTDNAKGCRSAHRDYDAPSFRGNFIGIRLSLVRAE